MLTNIEHLLEENNGINMGDYNAYPLLVLGSQI